MFPDVPSAHSTTDRFIVELRFSPYCTSLCTTPTICSTSRNDEITKFRVVSRSALNHFHLLAVLNSSLHSRHYRIFVRDAPRRFFRRMLRDVARLKVAVTIDSHTSAFLLFIVSDQRALPRNRLSSVGATFSALHSLAAASSRRCHACARITLTHLFDAVHANLFRKAREPRRDMPCVHAFRELE